MIAASQTYPRLVLLGDAALCVAFGDALSSEVHDRVLTFARHVERAWKDVILEVVPGFCTVTLYVDASADDLEMLADELLAEARACRPTSPRRGRLVEVPVQYGGEAGPDLPAVAAFGGLSLEAVIAQHAAVEYRVYLLGFSPGFPYLAPVPPALRIPRLQRPRLRVPAGSVAIAGRQTGIYPLPSPGGWRLIGRTPLRLFTPEANPPSLLRPGDRVRFVPIDAHEYERLARQPCCRPGPLKTARR